MTKKQKKNSFGRMFEHFANKVTRASGKPITFFLAFLVILTWGLTGPIFNYSNTWQLVINTGTTIITFLMVFVIQHSQNKDTTAVQLKLNELIASHSHASNRLIVVEELSAEELDTLKNFYIKLAELAKKDSDIHQTHSIEEASAFHLEKQKQFGGKRLKEIKNEPKKDK